MKLFEVLLLIILLMMVFITLYYWKMQRKLVKKKRRKIPKYELIEMSGDDQAFHDYYEPQIVEIISSEEFL